MKLSDPNAASFDVETTVKHLLDSLATVEWALAMIPEDWTHKSPSVTRLDARGPIDVY